MNKVNPAQIELARKSRLLSQSQLAVNLGIDQGKYSRIERGESFVTPELLDKLVDVLGYPHNFFFEPGNTLGSPLSLHMGGNFRKRQDLSKTVIYSVESIIGIYLSCLKKLAANIDIESSKTISPVNLNDFEGDIEHIAQQLRLQWGLPTGPIRDLTLVLENAGCLVVKHDFGTEKIDGFSIWPKDLHPIIFIREGMPGDRERFTLAHELGHLLFHTERLSPNKEQEANQFAAAFLLPASDIKPYLNQPNIYRLQALKEEWKVSMAALAYRAKDLKTINENQFKYLFMELSRNGYRKNEPVYIKPESPLTIKEMVDSHFKDLEYTEGELQDYLCLKNHDFTKYFSFHNPGPKVATLPLRPIINQ
jgi:Zn-dependent peptidase ImmA (M78 family)/transcriptional regulator with XRE-family HTH domain